MINIYANTGTKMAADLQVFSSDSLFSPLPATGTTTTHQYGHSRYLFVMAAFSLPIFFFFLLLVIWGLCFSPSIPQLSAMPVYVSIRIHLSAADPRLSDTILSGAKLVTATLIWKVGARFAVPIVTKKNLHALFRRKTSLWSLLAPMVVFCYENLANTPTEHL